MRQIFTLFALIVATGLTAQYTVTTTVQPGDPSSTRIPLYFDVTNDSQDFQEFFWDVKRTAGTPDDWDFSVCDTNLCYGWGEETCPCTDPSELAPGQTYTFTIYVNPNGIVGDHDVEFRILQTCGDENSLMSSTIQSFSIQEPTSTSDIYMSSILLYPNPVINSFRISDDANITAVSIFNVVGKEITTYSHKVGGSYDVTNLEKGIYLVRMMDKEQEVVKVIRMTKE